MGGNALTCGSIRINKPLYEQAVESLTTYCEGSLFDLFSIVEAVPSYENKDSFGDIDLMCMAKASKFPDKEELDQLLKDAFCATEIHHNGNVVSFDMRGGEGGRWFELGEPAIQVDLMIFTNYPVYSFAFNYFSFNDLGNLIGRIADSMGFKFGHDGLTYKYMNGTQLIKEIVITQDFVEAIEFLGLNSIRFIKGFNELEDIFKFVASSPYFHPDIYLLENRDGESRRRDKKRKTYMQFLLWCEANRDTLTNFPKTESSFWINKAFQAFPMFEPEFRNAMNIAVVQKAIKAVFNGNYVSGVTGLQGVELGNFMKRFKESYGSLVLFEQEALFEPQRLLNRLSTFPKQ